MLGGWFGVEVRTKVRAAGYPGMVEAVVNFVASGGAPGDVNIG